MLKMNKSITAGLYAISVSLLVFGCAGSQKLYGIMYVDENSKECTKLKCAPSDCCNKCFACIYLVTPSDTILLTGAPDGRRIVCIGTNCELKCSPFETGKKYEVTGRFKKTGSEFEIKSKAFDVSSYKLIEKEN